MDCYYVELNNIFYSYIKKYRCFYSSTVSVIFIITTLSFNFHFILLFSLVFLNFCSLICGLHIHSFVWFREAINFISRSLIALIEFLLMEIKHLHVYHRNFLLWVVVGFFMFMWRTNTRYFLKKYFNHSALIIGMKMQKKIVTLLRAMAFCRSWYLDLENL